MGDPWAKLLGAAIESRKSKLGTLSKYLWDNPELALKEFKAHDYLTTFLEAEGFSVQRHYILETAFRAEYSTTDEPKDPKVAFLCEYDALPEIGHACGHNLIAESSVAAGIAVKEAMKQSPNIRGKVIIVGTPGEENCGGKEMLLQKDGFRGIDVALMAHPSPINALKVSFLASQLMAINFHGHTAHAAAAPWEGVNALDAAVMSYMNVSLLRQQLKPSSKVHGVFLNAGKYPNIIPEESELKYQVRAPNSEELEVVISKVEACFRGASEATGCTVKIDKGISYKTLIFNNALVGVFRKHGELMGIAFKGQDPMLEFPVNASTDAGNLSHVVPTAHPAYAIDTAAWNHTREFATAAATAAAQVSTLRIAKVLALTALEVLRDAELRQRIREDFKVAVAAPATGDA